MNRWAPGLEDPDFERLGLDCVVTLLMEFHSEATQREDDAIECIYYLRNPETYMAIHCPHCRTLGAKRINSQIRLDLLFCPTCKKQGSARIGTIFEDSPVPLHQWLKAVCLYLGAKGRRGVTAEIQKALGVTYKTAWKMTQRLNEAYAERLAAEAETPKTPPTLG